MRLSASVKADAMGGGLTFNVGGGIHILIKDWSLPGDIEVGLDSHRCW